MIGVLAIVLGFQLLLQELVLDMTNEPGRLRRGPGSSTGGPQLRGYPDQIVSRQGKVRLEADSFE